MNICYRIKVFWFLILVLILNTPHGFCKTFEERVGSMSWKKILAEAKGQTVNWHMWGGRKDINRYVSDYLGKRLETKYGIKLNIVHFSEIKGTLDLLRSERRKGIFSKGSIDLIWINGENFRLLKKGRMLFQFAHKLPNMKYVDKKNPTIKLDFGYPVEGYESPYGGAQFVFNYDSAKVSDPPKSVGALVKWIKKNPGKFTYSGLPDFTGSAFVRHIFYHVAGGYENLMGPFDEEVFDKYAPKLWKLLKEIKPFLWKQGKEFPKDEGEIDKLVQKGDIYFGMGYGAFRSEGLIKKGIYPKTIKTLVFDEGTIGNTHYVTIPFNSKSKAGAMVLANLILEPSSQYEKMKPEVWGDQPILDSKKLPKAWKQKFKKFFNHPSTLSREELSSHQLPELQASWLLYIEDDWIWKIKRN